MINPTELIKPTDSTSRKQEFLLCCILSVGKNSDVAAAKLDLLLAGKDEGATPFDYLLSQDIRQLVLDAKTGQYQRVSEAILQALEVDVETVTLEQLQSIHGIGPKTARFFLVHAQGKTHAILDTHILKCMRGLFPDVPKATPPARHYGKWERLCLTFMQAKFPDDSPLVADLEIWRSQSSRVGGAA